MATNKTNQIREIAVNHWERHPESAVHTPMGGILSAAQHVADLTNNPEIGGASADLKTLHAHNPGDEKYLVGGTPDVRTGQAFPTQQVDYGARNPRMTVRDVMRARDKMTPAAEGLSSPVFGTWRVTSDKEPHKNRVDIDLATAFDNPRSAEDATLSRNEDAYFRMKDMSVKSNDDIRRERGLGERPPKMAHQEEIVRRHR